MGSDIFQPGDPVALIGPAWFAAEEFRGEKFRWVGNDAHINVAQLTGAPYALTLDLEAGPGIGQIGFDLNVLDESGAKFATAKVLGRQTVEIELPAGKPWMHQFTLHVAGGKTISGDARVLNYRVFKIAVVRRPSDVVRPGIGVTLGTGWHQLENFNNETFRWAENEAVIEARADDARPSVTLEVEPGPGVGLAPFVLRVLSSEKVISEIRVSGRQKIEIPCPKGQTARLLLQVQGGGKPVRGDARIMNFRAFSVTD